MHWMARVQFPAEARLLLPTVSRPALRATQSPIQWVLEALSPRVKQPECEASHSLLLVLRSSYTSTPQHIFMNQFLSNKAQRQLYLYLTYPSEL
jgi:hypothetical protein